MIFCWGLFASLYTTFLASPSGVKSFNQGGVQQTRVSSQVQINTISSSIVLFPNFPSALSGSSLQAYALFDGTIKFGVVSELMVIVLIGCACIILQLSTLAPTQAGGRRAETYQIQQVNQIGLTFMITAIDWLITIVAWELFNQSLYLQVSMNGSARRGPEGAELEGGAKLGEAGQSSSVKYFLQSAQTTSFLLLSIAQLYGETGTTSYDGQNMMAAFPAGGFMGDQPHQQAQVTFQFKLGAAPQHNWAPDLYDSLSTYITQWMVTIPKAAVLFMITQQLAGGNMEGFIQTTDPNIVGSGSFAGLAEAAAIFSLLVGSMGQGTQWKIKRFLAYSSIGAQGFALSSLKAFTPQTFFVIIYVISTIALFTIIQAAESRGFASGTDFISALGGMRAMNSSLAQAFSICLFSIAGCPPLAGFFAKLLILANLVEIGLYSVAFAAIAASVVSVCNYLSLVEAVNAKPKAGRRGAPGYAEGLTVKYEYAALLAYLVGVILVLPFWLSNTIALQAF